MTLELVLETVDFERNLPKSRFSSEGCFSLPCAHAPTVLHSPKGLFPPFSLPGPPRVYTVNPRRSGLLLPPLVLPFLYFPSVHTLPPYCFVYL